MKKFNTERATTGLALLLIAGTAHAATYTWDGDAATNSPADGSWATAANWVGNAVPPDGSGILFDHRATGLTSTLDAPRAAPLLDFTYTASGSSSHTVDLNGNVLTVSGSLEAGHERTTANVAGTAAATLRNGTIQLADGASVRVACGTEFRLKSTGALTLDATATCRAGSLADVLIGNSPTSNQTENAGSLNLSALVDPADLVWLNGAIEVPGTLNVSKLHVGYDQEDRYVGSAAFSVGTALTQLVVRTELFVGVASSATWTLPANVSYRIGDAQNGRADLRLNVAGGNRDAAGIDMLWRPAGGAFRAYLSSLQMGIGTSSDRGTGVWKAVLDLTNTAVTAFDVSGNVTIGGANLTPTVGTGVGQGTLRLPAVSARVGGNLVVDKGGAHVNRFGLLELHGTQLAVEGAVAVNAKGTVRCVFKNTNRSGDWLLRAPGDSVQAWQSHLAANRMTSAAVPSGSHFGAWARSGYTYLGLLPPAGTLIVIQ